MHYISKFSFPLPIVTQTQCFAPRVLTYPDICKHSINAYNCLLAYLELMVKIRSFKVIQTWSHASLKKGETTKTFSRKKNRTGGITQSSLKIYYKATIIKAVWYWHKNRHTDQQNRDPGSKSIHIQPADLQQVSKNIQ